MRKFVVLFISIALLLGFGLSAMAQDQAQGPSQNQPLVIEKMTDTELALSVQLTQSQIQTRQYEIAILQDRLSKLRVELERRQIAPADEAVPLEPPKANEE